MVLTQALVWKRGFSGQNNKNVRNFEVITDTILVIGKYTVHVKENPRITVRKIYNATNDRFDPCTDKENLFWRGSGEFFPNKPLSLVKNAILVIPRVNLRSQNTLPNHKFDFTTPQIEFTAPQNTDKATLE